jgi:hypothetical protein
MTPVNLRLPRAGQRTANARAGRGLRMTTAALIATLLCIGAQAAPDDPPRPKVEAQRGHAQCPLPGQDERTLLIDSPAQWRALVTTGEAQALGRKVRWKRERVLVHALAQQRTLGIQVAVIGVARAGPLLSPRLDVRVTRPAPDAAAATALSRPCVFVALTRGAWHEVRVADVNGHTLAIARLSKAAAKVAGDGAALAPALTSHSKGHAGAR